MVATPRIQEQHVAVFGEAGSGKTVLLSSFYGATQEGSYSNDLWDLVADDTGQGTRLYQNYLGMRDRSMAPELTKFASKTYGFSVKLKGGGSGSAGKQAFDALRLVWHDYPGEWFQETPTSDEEASRRVNTFRSLLRSDVALFLIDGQKLLDHQSEEERYLKSVLGNFRQGLLHLKDDLLVDQARLVEFPRIWIMALSKADLFPDWDVNSFRDLIIGRAAQDIERLRETVQDFVDTPEALSMGEDFMLLSSAKFELASSGLAPTSIDVTQRVGVDLILPVASLLPLERRVQWSAKMQIPTRVLDKLADGAGLLAAAIVGGRLAVVEKALAKVPKLGKGGSKVAIALLAAAAEAAGPKLKQMNVQAREQHDYLKATLTQFKLDLEQGRSEKLIRTAR